MADANDRSPAAAICHLTGYTDRLRGALFALAVAYNINIIVASMPVVRDDRIHNECYVVMTGSVGNLPNVENMDIQYSQAAMFSPADFAFPHDAIISEATPNTEMTLVSDLDLLKDLHYQGSVRNFRDRRLDLYRVEWLK